jgi:hypothetical protein
MKKNFYIGLLALALGFCLERCTKDRTFQPPPPVEPQGGVDNIVNGTIRINEFMAKNSAFYNELDPVPGDNDWLELFNTTDDTIYLVSGEWFLTDDFTDTTMFQLPDTIILPRGFITVHCDEQDTTITQIHSNFKLASSGESIGFYHRRDTAWIVVDEYSYGAQNPGVSMARFPDGTTNWVISANPTPDAPNQE